MSLLLPSLPHVHAAEAEPVKIGILAKRGSEQAHQMWSPTADYLNQAIPGHSFTMVPLAFDAVRQAVQDQTIDFLITNSGYYVELEMDYGVTRIATLKNLLNHTPKPLFGGVIFSRADRPDINTLADLRGKTFWAVDRDSLGGWLMAWRELHTLGIEPEDDFKSVHFAGTHDAVVMAVITRKADGGTVRTDTLERMAAEGKIDLASLKILNRQPPGAGFNYLRSTRLYPEWPFAKLQHTPEKLAEEVVVALLRMGPQDEAARAARIGGWTVPLDYQPVHMLLQELHLGPYAHHPGRITLADLVREHGMAMLVILVFFALLVMVSGYILHLNRRLAAARAELAGQLDKVQCAQESLQASERNYREIFHATNEAIFVHDQSSGAILDVNRAMCSMYGYGRDEVLSLDVGALSAGEPPYTMAEAAGWITRSRDEGPQTFTWRARRKNGELFWVEVNLKHAFIGGRERLLAVVHDITERKKAEDDLARHRLNLEKLVERRTADLRHSEENLAEAQRIAHLGSWEWLIPENVLWWSAEVYRIFDLTPDRFPATYEAFVAAVHPDDQKMVEQAVIDALTKGFPYSIEHRIVLADGRVRTVHERGETTRADDDGRPLKMIGTVQDITERKKAEEEKAVLEAQLIQTQKLEAIGTLAGGIAHDFNNILTVIVGYSELALADAGPENAPLRRDLSQVLQASMRAKDLVAQILAFSRREQVTKQPVIVSSIVKECLKLLRATIPATIEFRSRIEAATGRVWADPVQIHQVLMNLCTNAAHAMRERGGILTVSLTEEGVTATGDGHPPTLAPGRYLRLLVSDTGHGMAADTLGRIFDPFFTTKVKGEGTGMGLAVVHGIVKGCGGEIVVDSVKEEGTSFIVYLPSLAADVVSVEVGPLPAAARGSERILYVEDEAPLAELGKRLLESYGYLVTAETASIKALELFKASPQEFDLVITDQSMPQMSGGRLAEELLMVRPDIPIILCTGYSDEISEESAKAKGIRAFLFKPVKREVLLQKIREVLAPGGQ